jgi:hypothetical protein
MEQRGSPPTASSRRHQPTEPCSKVPSELSCLLHRPYGPKDEPCVQTQRSHRRIAVVTSIYLVDMTP